MVTSFSEKLYLSELRVARYRFRSEHYFNAGYGKKYASFGYLEKGRATLVSGRKRIPLQEGDFFYIPRGIPYHSIWQGKPDIAFYSLDLLSAHTGELPAERHAMQRIAPYCTPETGAFLEKLYGLLSSGEREDKIHALGLYFALYADLFPLLTIEPTTQYSPPLLAAIRYIEEKYREDFDVETLAAHCCISASRLYHLFQRELDTTPVRFRNELRIERAARELQNGPLSVEEIAELCGFHSSAYFRETFRQITGLTPAGYRALFSGTI